MTAIEQKTNDALSLHCILITDRRKVQVEVVFVFFFRLIQRSIRELFSVQLSNITDDKWL